MNKIALFALIGMAAVASSYSGYANAETVNTTAELLNNKSVVAYVFSPPMAKSMYLMGVEQDKKLGLQQGCKSQYKVKPVGAEVLKPIEFSEGKPHPTKGVWLARYQLERCGESKFYNALFFADNRGDVPVARHYYPGSSSAGAVLVRDAMTVAILKASVRSGLKDCKTFDVFDMRVTEAPHDITDGEKTFKGVWKETWSFNMCGKMVDVVGTFVPKATGGGTTFSFSDSDDDSTAQP